MESYEWPWLALTPATATRKVPCVPSGVRFQEWLEAEDRNRPFNSARQAVECSTACLADLKGRLRFSASSHSWNRTPNSSIGFPLFGLLRLPPLEPDSKQTPRYHQTPRRVVPWTLHPAMLVGKT